MLNQVITHSGSTDLGRQFTNAVIKADSRGTRIIKEHKHSTRRIDLAVAAIVGPWYGRHPSNPLSSPR